MYKAFGKTEMKLSVIGLGGWQAGFKSWGSNYTKEDIINAINKAIELGVNFIDTAEIYGNGRSEEILGNVIGNRDDVFIATKVAGYNARPGKISKAAQASLKRLRRDIIDLYQIHWPPSYYTDLCKVMRELESLVDKGVIRYIGVSNFSRKDLEKAINCLKKHEIVSNQVQYNLLYRPAEVDLLPFMRDNGIEIIAWSPLAKGALAGKLNPDSWAKKMDSSFKRAREANKLFEVMAEIANKHNATLSQVSLAWIVSKDGFPIPGAKNPAQAKLNALAGSINLDNLDVSRLDEASKKFLEGEISSVMSRFIPNLMQQALLKIIGGV